MPKWLATPPKARVLHQPVGWGVAHARPQAPQAVTLVARLDSQPLAGLLSQSAKPVLQVNAQAPVRQAAEALASAGQAVPHMPQLVASLWKSAHTPLAGQ
jgi:hypothetical protein